MYYSKFVPKTRNPRSELKVVGSRNDFRTRKDTSIRHRDTSADYPCPVCRYKMYKDEDISFGVVALPDGGKHTGKFHTVCPDYKEEKAP